MSFASVVSSILHIGEDVAPEVASSLFSPAAGALVSLVLNGVTSAEQSGNTTEQTIQDLIPAATGIVNSVMQAKGASVSINPAQLSDGADPDGFRAQLAGRVRDFRVTGNGAGGRISRLTRSPIALANPI